MEDLKSNMQTEDIQPLDKKLENTSGNQDHLETTDPLNGAFAPTDCNLLAVIPAYNEDRFIGSMVLKVRNYVDQVIVIDDGSQDSTAQVAETAGALVIRHAENLGKGAALNTGLAKARQLQPDAVILLDADGQHDPAEIPAVINLVLDCSSCQSETGRRSEFKSGAEHQSQSPGPALVEKADIVIGSRYLVSMSDVPRHRIWGHWIYNRITRLATSVGSSDSQSGFRALSPRALQLLTFSSTGFSVESEMQFLAAQHNLVVTEAPITISYTEKPKRNVVQHGLGVLNGILRLTGQYRPLLFFGLPGLLLLLVGIGWGWWVVDIYSRVKTLAVGYAMISVLFSIVGVVMLSTGVILHSIRGLLLDFFRTQFGDKPDSHP